MNQRGNDMSDGELIQKYLSTGDESIFRRLFDRHHEITLNKLINKMGDKYNSQDAMQIAWLKVLSNLGKYIDENFPAWLFSIAYHAYISVFIRKNKEFSCGVFDCYIEEGLQDYDEKILHKSSLKISNEPYKEYDTTLLQESIFEIENEMQQEVVLLRTYRNTTFKNISFHLKMNINTSLGSYRYALMKLKKMMEEKGYIYEKEKVNQ